MDPGKLQIAPSSFVTTDGTSLPQLGFHEVVSQAQGVAFCSALQVAPFLSPYRSLSVDPLALVVTAELPIESCAGAPVTNVQFPAIYSPTGEAILLHGSLVQLGDESVGLKAADIAEVDSLDTLTCKLSLFREETALDWAEVCQAPVRILMQSVPGFSLCKDQACPQDCARFHAAVDETVDRLFLDVWNRQYHRLEGGRSAPGDAAVFSCYVRVPASALMHLQKVQFPGLYCEPRAPSGLGPHESFAVVWLQATTLTAAQHILRTCPKAISLARLGRKWGIRVRDSDEKEVFTTLKPGQEFVRVRVTCKHRLFPLPHGFQRKHVLQLLKTWNWQAKPLQPVKGDGSGSAWEVGSNEEPPAPALPLGSSYVLITKVRDSSGSAGPAPAISASARTKKRIIFDDGEGPEGDSDPWANGRDPWAISRSEPAGQPGLTAISGTAANIPSTAETKLSQLRQDLAAQVKDLVQEQVANRPASSQETVHETRLQKLEVGVQELQLQNSKFETWFQKFGQQVAATGQQVQEVASAVVQQKTELVQVQTEVARQAEAVQTSVQQAVGHMQAEVSHQIGSQFERLEALLAKRSRSE